MLTTFTTVVFLVLRQKICTQYFGKARTFGDLARQVVESGAVAG